MEDERNFYEDEPTEGKEVIGYCAYCKVEIFEGDEMVEYKGKKYHKDCFIQEHTGEEPGIND